jgi:diguanylate cyclase (GGDEF)-like protein
LRYREKGFTLARKPLTPGRDAAVYMINSAFAAPAVAPPPDARDQSAPAPVVVPTDEPELRLLALTLSIMTAHDEAELIGHTLQAAVELTGATFAVALAATKPPAVDGLDSDEDVEGTQRSELGRAGDWAICSPLPAAVVANLRTSNGGPTEALAPLGLASALTATLGETLIVVAAAEPGRLDHLAGSLLALVVAHARAGLDRLRELARLSRQATSDPLTGLRHQRSFAERLTASVPGHTAILAIDIDDFKTVNDKYGHQAGDEALVCLVEALRAALRGDDLLYRIGGDEFAVIVDVNSPDEALVIASRLLDSARSIGHPVSIGVALRHDGETGRDAVQRADTALYRAKRAGRDTVRISP